MRSKLFVKNTISLLIFQIVTIICGFVLPWMILNYYGSNVNGLIHSIAQFLQVITFLELGVGATIQSSLYKPLSKKNNKEISKVIAASDNFFKKIVLILLFYIIILIIFYPLLLGDTFSWIYTATLILAISFSMLSGYYFGVTNSLLLSADQRSYIDNSLRTIIVILNTIVGVILISFGSSIQMVKLVAALIFLIRPIYLNYYVNKHYNIDRKVKTDNNSIKQKWNGIAQHISMTVFESTDYIVLTIFSTLSNVSVYSVYYLVVKGIKLLITSSISSIQSLFGELWAKKDRKKLDEVFNIMEWLTHNITLLLFFCTTILIVPFVTIYTKGITDANYNRPLFALLITLSTALYCLRIPYHLLIKAVGQYKETQKIYIITAIINIVVSIIAVKMYGLVGVAIGTLIAVIYQIINISIYCMKNILKINILKLVKQSIIDLCIIIASYYFVMNIRIANTDYISWCVSSLKVLLIITIISIVINIIFYRSNIKYLFKKIKNL